MDSLDAPSLKHGPLKESDAVGVRGEVKVFHHFLDSVQQLCGVWDSGSAVLSSVLLRGIGRTDPAELVGVPESLQVL